MKSFFNLPRVSSEEILNGAITRGTVVLVGSKVVGKSVHSAKGMKKAADVLREASQEITGYLPEIDLDVHFQNVVDGGTYGEKQIGKIVNVILAEQGIPFVIGGDHSTTYFALKETEIPSILWLDSHTDVAKREELPEAEEVSHGSALRQLVETGKKAIVMGFRGYASIKSELERAKKLGIKVFSYPFLEKKLARFLKDSPAISLDLDFFNATAFPPVRTPEIYGPSVNDLIKLLRKIRGNFHPQYLDIVEYLPSRDLGSYASVLSQIILELLGTLLT
ncbi:MAG: hypothetical protein GWO20_16475 [Candidatus Korarchaeota archaeon]|nr:hypothetical protein [Candidatus Korarchaeota archaeon]NIU85098.1 hypothetical protein [Candidatus Thorarchaeota archaeon]NIW15025.1 hypothetical protein [Candidatus Thorarchaeota archaeon]NIW53035.1 hypothetical protein [Candidatus Korarchaeota archaeon]